MKKAIISLSVLAILTICMFNSVAAAPVSKQTPDVHNNYVGDVRGGEQLTHIHATLGIGEATAVTMGVGQYTYLRGVLSHGVIPTSSDDCSHGIPNAMINIQSINSDGQTWTTVDNEHTLESVPGPGNPPLQERS